MKAAWLELLEVFFTRARIFVGLNTGDSGDSSSTIICYSLFLGCVGVNSSFCPMLSEVVYLGGFEFMVFFCVLVLLFGC